MREKDEIGFQNLDDSYQMMDLMHERAIQARMEEQKRSRLENAETRTKVLTELTLLQRDMAKEQTGKLDVVTKNFKETKKNVTETGEELVKFKDENSVDNGKLMCYVLVLFCILMSIVALNWLMNA